jgi:hypothetical protein
MQNRVLPMIIASKETSGLQKKHPDLSWEFQRITPTH